MSFCEVNNIQSDFNRPILCTRNARIEIADAIFDIDELIRG